MWWLLACVAFGGDIYVSASAAPGGDGASFATAYRTLDKALGNAGPGDTVRVGVGTYREGGLLVPRGVRLLGAGSWGVTVEGDGGVGITTLSAEVKGLSIEGFDVGLRIEEYRADGEYLTDLRFEGNGVGLSFADDQDGNFWRVWRVAFVGNGIGIEGPGYDVSSSTFVGNDIGVHAPGRVSVYDSTFRDGRVGVRLDADDWANGYVGQSAFANLEVGVELRHAPVTEGRFMVFDNRFEEVAAGVTSPDEGDVIVERNEFHGGTTAVDLALGAHEVVNNLITGHGTGVRFDSSASLIAHNTIDASIGLDCDASYWEDTSRIHANALVVRMPYVREAGCRGRVTDNITTGWVWTSSQAMRRVTDIGLDADYAPTSGSILINYTTEGVGVTDDLYGRTRLMADVGAVEYYRTALVGPVLR